MGPVSCRRASVRAPAPRRWRGASRARAASAPRRGADLRPGDGRYRGSSDPCQVCSSSTVSGLACAEGNDAPDRVVRRDANCDAIAGNYLDAEAAHSAAELGQHFVAGVTLHAVEPAAVHCHHGALHVNKIVLAQLLARPFFKQTLCHS